MAVSWAISNFIILQVLADKWVTNIWNIEIRRTPRYRDGIYHNLFSTLHTCIYSYINSSKYVKSYCLVINCHLSLLAGDGSIRHIPASMMTDSTILNLLQTTCLESVANNLLLIGLNMLGHGFLWGGFIMEKYSSFRVNMKDCYFATCKKAFSPMSCKSWRIPFII